MVDAGLLPITNNQIRGPTQTLRNARTADRQFRAGPPESARAGALSPAPAAGVRLAPTRRVRSSRIARLLPVCTARVRANATGMTRSQRSAEVGTAAKRHTFAKIPASRSARAELHHRRGTGSSLDLGDDRDELRTDGLLLVDAGEVFPYQEMKKSRTAMCEVAWLALRNDHEHVDAAARGRRETARIVPNLAVSAARISVAEAAGSPREKREIRTQAWSRSRSDAVNLRSPERVCAQEVGGSNLVRRRRLFELAVLRRPGVGARSATRLTYPLARQPARETRGSEPRPSRVDSPIAGQLACWRSLRGRSG